MEIKNVQLDRVKSEELGIDYQLFDITFEDDSKIGLRADNTASPYYWQVRDWFEAQKKEPFGFIFEYIPKPVFAEIVYPATSEEVDNFLNFDVTEDEGEDVPPLTAEEE